MISSFGGIIGSSIVAFIAIPITIAGVMIGAATLFRSIRELFSLDAINGVIGAIIVMLGVYVVYAFVMSLYQTLTVVNQVSMYL